LKPSSARALALLGGVVFAASTPPIDFRAGILVGLVAYALAFGHATAQPRARSGAAYGWLFGMGANLVALRFVPEVITRFTPLPAIAGWCALVLLSAAQALPWAIGGAMGHVVARKVGGVPVWLAFALGIYLATFVPAIFPWTPAGGLAPWPAFLQIAEVVGERGTSLVLALSTGLAAHAIERARSVARDQAMRAAAAPLCISLGILAVLLLWGVVRMGTVESARQSAPHARVALVQPGFEASDRWEASRASMMIDRLTTLTKSAEQRGSELTIWPESAYPFTLPHATRRSPDASRAVLQHGVRGPVLTGAYMAGGPGVGYNSAILATADGALSEPYDKRHLLWFGETVPLGDTFPWLRRTFAKGTGLEPGKQSVAFVTGPFRAAVLNCYEDTLPEAGREAMGVAPNLLVNVTNDAWFAGSAEGELHLRLAVLRAIETRRDLVRAVNKGPTSFVDANGRVVARYESLFPASLPVSPALLATPPTFYVRYGDLPVVVLAAASVVVAGLERRRRRPR
jgi:apolipoprotein N-acyltransferase